MVNCPKCGSSNVQSRGYNQNRDKKRFECQEDHSRYVDENDNDYRWFSLPIEKIEEFKVGVIDIELLPLVAYAWGIYEQNINMGNVIKDTCLLSWAGKYLNSTKIYSDILTPEEALNRDARRITKSAFDFIRTCNVVIGHNWNGYDGKILNTYFLKYEKPLKYLTIDTLLVARSNFRFTSNKLKDINNELGIRNKIDNDGMPLWIACDKGDKKALDTMLEYNEGDIFSTEELYYRIRGFIPNHPNLARYTSIEVEQCPICLSTELVEEGKYPAGKGQYKSMRCSKCGSLHRFGKNLLSKKKRESLLSQ